MKYKTFAPFTILGNYWLAVLFHVVFMTLLAIVVVLLVAVVEQREVTPEMFRFPAVILFILVLFRLSYRIVVFAGGELVKLPLVRKYNIKEMIGVTYGEIIRFGGVVYNVKCFFEDGSYLRLSVDNPKSFVDELVRYNPDLLSVKLHSK